MGILSILLLLLIAYLCFKAIGNIWRDATDGVGTAKTQRGERPYAYAETESSESPAGDKKRRQRLIEKGEGEYVDFEVV